MGFRENKGAGDITRWGGGFGWVCVVLGGVGWCGWGCWDVLLGGGGLVVGVGGVWWWFGLGLFWVFEVWFGVG